jgi:Ca-activated chloride channel family protein
VESLNLWERTKKTSDVILVFDKSGSMRGDPLKQAQMGAISFLKAMGDRDSVSLQFFDSTVLDATPVALLGGGGREQLSTIIQNSIASGGTALYDAVDAAYKEASQRADKEPKRIHAVVVMTDGNDENSTLQLQQLTQHFQSGEEGSVRVFTIAYGSGADPKVLSQIAEQAGGATMTGDSKNIDALFRDMAAFF